MNTSVPKLAGFFVGGREHEVAEGGRFVGCTVTGNLVKQIGSHGGSNNEIDIMKILLLLVRAEPAMILPSVGLGTTRRRYR